MRTLCHDIGQALGCGGCMSSLTRTVAGQFRLEQALTVEQIVEFCRENDPQALLLPVDALFSQYLPLIVPMGQAVKLRNGADVRDWKFSDGTYRVYAEDGSFFALGEVHGSVLHSIKSFCEVN